MNFKFLCFFILSLLSFNHSLFSKVSIKQQTNISKTKEIKKESSLSDIYKAKKSQFLVDPAKKRKKTINGERKSTLPEESQIRAVTFIEWLTSRKKGKTEKSEKEQEKINVKDSFKKIEEDFKQTEAKINNWRENVIPVASKELQEKANELKEAQKNIDEFNIYFKRNPEDETLQKMKKDLEKQLAEKEVEVEKATKKLIEVNKRLVDLNNDLKNVRKNGVEKIWNSFGLLKDMILDRYKKAEENFRDIKASFNNAQIEVDRLTKEKNDFEQNVKKDKDVLQFNQKINEELEDESFSSSTYSEVVEKIKMRLENSKQLLAKSEKKLKAAKNYRDQKKEELDDAKNLYKQAKNNVLKVIEDADKEKSLVEDTF